jgi:hypothetical protein
MKKSLFDRMMALDRRWVFLFLAVACVSAYAAAIHVPLPVNDEVSRIYRFIDTLKPGQIVFIAIDYDPNSQAELHPMTYAVSEQCFRKELKVIYTALSQNGPGMADQAIRDISDSMKQDRTYNGIEYKGREIKSGVDYVFLGYKAYFAIQILAMGQDFRLPFPQDYYGVKLDSLPMMKGVRNYGQIACVVDIGGGNITDAWISYGQGRFGFPMALGLTGVMATIYYPYLNSGQVFGIMGGLLGAAQYEQLCDNPGLAADGMGIQLLGHIVIILFIIIGNVGFFMSRRTKRLEGR